MNLSMLLENFLKASQRLSKLPEASQRRPDPEPTKAGPRTHKRQDPEPTRGRTPNPDEADPEPTKGRTPNPQKADKNPKFQGAKTEVISILKNARFTRSGAKS